MGLTNEYINNLRLLKEEEQPLVYQNGVYKITCFVNNRSYVGSSQTVRNRLLSHRKQLRLNSHPIICMQNEFNAYGLKCFAFDVIEICGNIDRAALYDIEQMYIIKYDCIYFGYNSQLPGEKL